MSLVLVITPHAPTAGIVVTCWPLGVPMMDDEAGSDAKLLAVPRCATTPS
jgi:inorganic pyrophosphatase